MNVFLLFLLPFSFFFFFFFFTSLNFTAYVFITFAMVKRPKDGRDYKCKRPRVRARAFG